MSVIDDHSAEFQQAVDHLKKELSSIRTGRAHTALVEGLQVEAYGTAQELKNLASITVSDPRTLRIEPWDASIVSAIEKAIQESDIGINPAVDGKVIRLAMPQMTEETRKELIKSIGRKVEEARIAVRNVRDQVKKEIERMEKAKELTEDDRFELVESLDKRVADVNKTIETLGKEKEQQVSTV
ncbi:ribosome recycling factor [Candidatus Uhrbacteria bacterium RIFCSPHIGHO2_02_FULL_53_13]|uniref:Ribosome-recycling factor n=1 Tax=Candidatus Uhrbacteria bacterium RIFCSPHIGHO2_02_FULL_53_13 TaxID=1802389 RepID=A0A1F7U1N4_9BACT|nr:MAG: ribosome recycling factor [Candidatus Uhrbacteria bacterium RIFCSPHIGHO2_02_FULL_53_13]